jgi:hypothetical protein
METKNDHSSPILRFLPSCSEITRARMYQAVKIALNQ